MKKLILLLTMTAMLSASAQAQFSHFRPARSIIPNELMPKAQNYLPDYARPEDPQFVSDSIFYEIGKAQRDTPRGEVAKSDASTSASYYLKRFGQAMGVPDMNQTDFPAVYELVNVTMNQARNSIQSSKDYFKRERPYSHFAEPSALPHSEMQNDLTSYPSGHAVRAWAVALALVGVDPEHQDEILKVGYEMGQSRVIVGYHYQSDIDAARVCASAAFARICTEPEWLELFNAAKSELVTFHE